jgi:hypothetical protein
MDKDLELTVDLFKPQYLRDKSVDLLSRYKLHLLYRKPKTVKKPEVLK